MQNDNDVHTIIDSNGAFSLRNNYKYTVPLMIKGNDHSLSEIAISLSMGRDSNYRMPNDLRVYLSSWSDPCSPVTIDLTRIVSDHYTSHLRTLFPTRNALNTCLKEQVTTFVRHHTDPIPDPSLPVNVEKYLKSLWESIPPEDAPAEDSHREMGNGAFGDNFDHAHWFILPHAILAIPPVQLLATIAGDSIRRLSADLILEVTSGDPSLPQSERTLLNTCGAFRLSVDVARQNPLTDELEQIRNRLNGHDTEIATLKCDIGKLDTRVGILEQITENHTIRLDGHDTEIATLKCDIGKLNTRIDKLEQWKDDMRTLIEVQNSAGDKTILIDGEEGDIKLL